VKTLSLDLAYLTCFDDRIKKELIELRITYRQILCCKMFLVLDRINEDVWRKDFVLQKVFLVLKRINEDVWRKEKEIMMEH